MTPTGIEAKVCEDIARRQQFGLHKYGTTVAESPLELRQWRVVDAQGVATTVSLSEIETGMKLDPELFRFVDPRRKAPDFPE